MGDNTPDPGRQTTSSDDATPSLDREIAAASVRARLVEHLTRERVLDDESITRAFMVVPRHLFLPALPLEQAYADTAVATHFASGTAISSASQPAIVAIMLQQLQPFNGMRVLEIGAGTGYNAALLAELAGTSGHVTTVEIGADIAAEARAHLAAAGYTTVEVVTADGAGGWAANAPYDRVELSVGASDLSPAWVAQLQDAGRLVLPLWLGASDASVAFRKVGARLESDSLAPCGFMRLRGADEDTRKWAELVDGWRIAAERADELAPVLNTLLRLRPRGRHWPRDDAHLGTFAQYLALNGHQVLLLWPSSARKRHARIRQRIGLFAVGTDGPSLCLFGAATSTILSFGGGAAERDLAEAWHQWQVERVLPLEQWQIVAYPNAAGRPASPPLGVARRTLRHFTFDIRYLAVDG